MVSSVDPQSFRLLTFNSSFRDHFLQKLGLRVQIGMSPKDIFLNQDLVDQWSGFFQRALAESPYTIDYVVSTGSGVLQLTFSLLRRDDKVFGISVFGKDITERKRAEEALRRNEERYRALVTVTSQIVWKANPQGEVEDNRAWGAFTGLSGQEAEGC
jgi:PAS domain-containing protein